LFFYASNSFPLFTDVQFVCASLLSMTQYDFYPVCIFIIQNVSTIGLWDRLHVLLAWNQLMLLSYQLTKQIDLSVFFNSTLTYLQNKAKVKPNKRRQSLSSFLLKLTMKDMNVFKRQMEKTNMAIFIHKQKNLNEWINLVVFSSSLFIFFIFVILYFYLHPLTLILTNLLFSLLIVIVFFPSSSSTLCSSESSCFKKNYIQAQLSPQNHHSRFHHNNYHHHHRHHYHHLYAPLTHLLLLLLHEENFSQEQSKWRVVQYRFTKEKRKQRHKSSQEETSKWY